MVAYNGSLVLLKIKIENDFVSIGGMRTTKFSLTNQIIDASNKDSGNWRELLPGGVVASVSIGGNGIFINSGAEKTLTSAAFLNDVKEFQISFASGNSLIGKFHLTHYERTGNFGEEETYSIMLESTGKIEYM